MSRQEKNNRIFFGVLLVMYICMSFLSGIYFINDNRAFLKVLLPIMVAVIAVVANFIHLKRNKDSTFFMIQGSWGYFLVYALLLHFGKDDSSTWSLIIPLYIALSIFASVKTTVISGAIGFAINLSHIFALLYRGNLSFESEIYRIFTLLSTIIILILVSRVTQRFNKEDMNRIIEHEKKQQLIAESVLKLANTITQKLVELENISMGIGDSTSNITSSIENITTSISSTAERIQNQTAQTQEIQASIDEMTSFSEDVKEVAVDTKQAADEGISEIKNVLKTNTELNRKNVEVSDSMTTLRDRMQEVIKIVDMISGISSQTNLLALNASIEAARAGEAGRGFSVVADEIGQLASRTKSSASEISKLIAALYEDASVAGQNIDTAISSMEVQTQGIYSVSRVFGRIDKLVEKLEKNVEKSSKMTMELGAANTVIVESTEEFSANIEEITASAEEITSLSTNNLEAVNKAGQQVLDINELCREFEKFQ